ncbi:MAG TPA: hypothetical protein PKC28_00730 [Bdellovibrionales bacterium]|nr:hypothetical protein [Bdellovibrionales bacterium]
MCLVVKHSPLFAFLLVLLWLQPLAAQHVRQTYPYICSDGNVYSVFGAANGFHGITKRGVWQKFGAFCDAKHSEFTSCAKDVTPATIRCYGEFRAKGNLDRVDGLLVFWIGKIRHAASASWFDRTMAARKTAEIRDICKRAVVSLGCVKRHGGLAAGEQLKCAYDRSSSLNRAAGRNCYTGLNRIFEDLARAQIASGTNSRAVASHY